MNQGYFPKLITKGTEDLERSLIASELHGNNRQSGTHHKALLSSHWQLPHVHSISHPALGE